MTRHHRTLSNALGVLGLLLGLLPAEVLAADYYVSQNGGGGGSSSSDTLSLAWLNADSTWTAGPGKVRPGDTVHLVGTFTNGIDTSAVVVGDYGNPVTFLFEPNASFTAPAWGQKFNTANSYSNGQAFYMPNINAVVIDGGSNGIIQATANAAGWLTWSNRCDGMTLGIQGGSFEIKNLTISNLYQRFNGQDDAYTPGHTGDGAYGVGGQAIKIGGWFTNSSIHNCNISGTANLIAISYSGGDTRDVQVYSNNLSHFSFAIQVYGTGTAAGDNWKIWANTMNPGTDWSGNNTYSHVNGIILNQHQQADLLFDPFAVQAYYDANGNYVKKIPARTPVSRFAWFPRALPNNFSLQNGTQFYTNPMVSTVFVPVTDFVTFHGTPNSAVSAHLYYQPNTNYTSVYEIHNLNVANYTNGSVIIPIPQWGNYGSYYNWTRNGDTNNISLLNGTNLMTSDGSFAAVTNFVTLFGVPNSPTTCSLYRLHAATNVNMQIYRNYFGPTWGTNSSNWIGVYADMPSGFQYYKIFNNLVVIDNITQPSLIGNSIGAADHALLANNSLIQLNRVPIGVGCVAGFGGGTVLNNLFYNFNKAVSFNTAYTDSRGWGKFHAINHNCYYGISEWMSGQGSWPSEFYHPTAYQPFYPAGVAVYRRADGYDNNSTTNKPLLSLTTYKPLPNDSVLVGKGMNLTGYALSNNIPDLTNDFYGTPRPASGPWTIGAFEVPFTGVSLIAPSSLRVTNN